MNRRTLVKVGAAALASATFGVGAAEAKVADIRRAVVSIRVTGIRRDSNEEMVVLGSGFFVNSQGTIVTAFHLIKQLGDVHEGTVNFHINTDHTESWIAAYPINRRPEVDILVLSADMGLRPFTFVRRAKNAKDKIKLAQTPLWTAGFPAGFGYMVSTGYLSAFAGPLSPLSPTWTTNMTFKGGASGSPIFLEDGTVVAIAKGVDADATQIGLVVPANLVPAESWEDEALASGRPSNIEDLAALPTLELTRLTLAVTPRTRFAALNIDYDSCTDVLPRQLRIAATPGWTIAPAPAAVRAYEMRGRTYRTTIAEQLPSAIRVIVESDASCTGQPAFIGVVEYTEVPNVGTQETVQIAETTVFAGVPVQTGLSSLSGVSAVLKTPDGRREIIDLKSSDIKKVGNDVFISSERIGESVRQAMGQLARF